MQIILISITSKVQVGKLQFLSFCSIGVVTNSCINTPTFIKRDESYTIRW